jgi:hypothetical protein
MSYSVSVSGHGADLDKAVEAFEDFVHALRAATGPGGDGTAGAAAPSGTLAITEEGTGRTVVAQELEWTEDDSAGGFGAVKKGDPAKSGKAK